MSRELLIRVKGRHGDTEQVVPLQPMNKRRREKWRWFLSEDVQDVSDPGASSSVSSSAQVL